MRVLYVTQNPNRQSTTVPTEGWFRVLPAKGLEPVLVSSREGAFSRWAREHDIPAYVLPLPFPDRLRPVPFVASLASLVRIGRRHRVDLIHSNEQDVYPIAQYAARLLGVPKVVSIHFSMGRPFCQWAFGGRRQPDRLVFTSQSNEEVCRTAIEGIVPAQAQTVLRNGVDLAHLHPDELRRADARRRYDVKGDVLAIGVACALRPRKQLEHLFRAAARLQEPLQVLVAGGAVAGDEAYAEQLLQEGRELLADRLTVLGHLDDLRDFYNALDLFVNTSQEETCSLSVIEALACGCPIVGYASTSVHEQILPDGGEIVAQDDDGMLGDVLDRWLSNPARLQRGRLGARRQAERLFDIRARSEDLWNLYGEVLSRRTSTTAPQQWP